MRSTLEKWLRELNPDAYRDRGNGRRDFPGMPYEADGWRIQFNALPKSPEARRKEGVRPLGIISGGRAFWVQDEEGIKNALNDKGSAYGSLGAPYVVAVASSSITTDDYDVKNALYGTEALLIGTGPGGEIHSDALIRNPDGYWHKGDHWDHRHVSAVLVVKQLHPAFVGTQQHTIWEHPAPEWSVPPAPDVAAIDGRRPRRSAFRRSCAHADGVVRPYGPVADRGALPERWVRPINGVTRS
ncbi:hypothetical protein [Microtetraspora glauca]|uniref:Uncharacterized protein n=1 Tax=Microtetraspora glauca TaxID=1996 RepID=A0ABV3GJQ4_MICGL